MPKTLFGSHNLDRTAAKSVDRRVTGSFCVLTREMANTAFCRFAETMAGGSLHIRPIARGITPSSHVTQDAKCMTNAGRTLGAGLVAGACPRSGR